jgi:hypothetical protein
MMSSLDTIIDSERAVSADARVVADQASLQPAQRPVCRLAYLRQITPDHTTSQHAEAYSHYDDAVIIPRICSLGVIRRHHVLDILIVEIPDFRQSHGLWSSTH